MRVFAMASSTRLFLARAASVALWTRGSDFPWPVTLRTSAGTPALTPASRYAVTEGGLLHAPERTYRAWSDVKAKGRLHTKYEGKRKVEEVGGRVVVERERVV